MQRAVPSLACDCTPETLRIVTAIRESTYPPPPDANNNNTSRAISLGDILGAGRLLVRNWERLNGCSNASSHLDAAMLRTIAEAANGLLGLYKTVGVSARILPTITTPSRAATGKNVLGSSGDTPAPVTLQSDTYLGTHALDEVEAIMVGREALRHSVLLLGEVLHDISKDLGDLGGGDTEDTRAMLDKSSTDMLRLLGRINT
ncbi:hypothetical protein SLS64_013769 [Diaporthe eres]|uniref:Uncharacterized protein n=1 Tax=Diaporthe eres TaxID=83184 RepID=A0ABR1P3K5_DIAER